MQLTPPCKPPFQIIHKFGDKMSYGSHKGIDFAKFKDYTKPFSYNNVLNDWTVFSPCDGKIIEKRWSSSGGNIYTIEIDSEFRVWLAHFKQQFNTVGTIVKRGDPIGIAGTTPGLPWSDYVHCHLQLYQNGEIVDPKPYMLITENMFNNHIIRKSDGSFAYVKGGNKQLITRENAGLALITYIQRLDSSAHVKDWIVNVTDAQWDSLPTVTGWF